MFFPSRKSDANTGPASKGGNAGFKPSRNGKETSPQKAVSRSAPSKPPANNSLASTSTNPVGSLTAILSARSGGDDNIPTADSEQLVARLFKGLGVPMYQPRIPIAYKKEPVPPALKNYRWSAFDLTISHDTMLTIAKPPPPQQSFAREPPSPPLEEVDEEPRLLISNLPALELESPPIGPPELEPIAQLIERSVKLERLTSQKMRSSVKVAPLNKKASAKLLTEFNDWKEAHSTKQANANVAFSIKMQSVKVSKRPEEIPSEEDAELGNFDQPETKAAAKVERKRSMVPSSILEDVESEQLIDGLLDMSLNATTEATGLEIDTNTLVSIEPFAPVDVDATPADTKLPTEDSSVAVISTETTVNADIEPPEEAKPVPAEEAPVEAPLDSRLASVKIIPVIPPQPSKSVKSPNSTSFFSSLLNSISSKVPGFGGDGKGSDEEEEEEVVPIEQSSFSIKKNNETNDSDKPTEGTQTGVSERKTGATQSVKEVPSETHFDFYAEAAKLAADAATDANASEQAARQSNNRAPPAVSFTIDGASSSKQSKPAAHVGAIISPAERSVFKPTFAMPRPSQQEQDPLAAQLVRELQQGGGAKQLPLQTGPQSVEGPAAPLSGPKNKKRKDNFSILEDLFLDGQPSAPPPNAAKYAVDLQNSDSEGETNAAYNQGKNKKAKKTPKPQKKVSPAKAQPWYLAGAYSSHHEAIDALNRMHKLLAGAAADPNDPSLDLDNKFRLQRDLSRMQWVVECCDAQHKAMILSHATRSPVVPEKDKSKFRNIVGAIKEDTPAYQGAGAGIYHSPPQAHHPNGGSEHKPHEEHFLRERDAFYENNMRMVKANLSPHESPPPKQSARRQGPQSKQHSPPPRGSGASVEKQGAKSAPKEGNGSRFPAIPQAQIPKQSQGQRKGKDAK